MSSFSQLLQGSTILLKALSSYSDNLFSLPLQSYSMRNGILGLMGEIVVKVLCKEDLDDVSKKLRDQLLDKMEASVRMVVFSFFTAGHITYYIKIPKY